MPLLTGGVSRAVPRSLQGCKLAVTRERIQAELRGLTPVFEHLPGKACQGMKLGPGCCRHPQHESKPGRLERQASFCAHSPACMARFVFQLKNHRKRGTLMPVLGRHRTERGGGAVKVRNLGASWRGHNPSLIPQSRDAQRCNAEWTAGAGLRSSRNTNVNRGQRDHHKRGCCCVHVRREINLAAQPQ